MEPFVEVMIGMVLSLAGVFSFSWYLSQRQFFDAIMLFLLGNIMLAYFLVANT